MNIKIENLVRQNIKLLKAYSSARKESNGLNGYIYLDANENPFPPLLKERGLGGEVKAARNLAFNRYPDPNQSLLKQKISELKNISSHNIFLGNGSDEAIDLLLRIFCEPRTDNIIILPPTYGMYEVQAGIQDIEVKKVPLSKDFQIDNLKIFMEIDRHTKLIFICSPNNPTGNTINTSDIIALLKHFKGIVVIDEAYIDFSGKPSSIKELTNHNNLVILQTFSKAWGLAALRMGMAFASTEIIQYMNKIKYPYNINTVTQQLVLEALDNTSFVESSKKTIIQQRQWLHKELLKLPNVFQVLPSEANFLFVRTKQMKSVYNYLKTKGIIVRYKDWLRITVGTAEENKLLIKTLSKYETEA